MEQLAKNDKSNLFDKFKEDMLMEVVEGVLPKIKPFLKPAVEKMNEWFGEDDKIIIIKKNKNQGTKVIILDNKKGEYEIVNSINSKKFSVDRDSIIGVHDIENFIEKVISGDITKL